MSLTQGAGGLLVFCGAAGWLSLLSWSLSDPSLTHATGGPIRNWLGGPGAILSDLLLQTLFGCRVYETYGHKIATGDYSAGFKMSLGLKDLRLATEAAGNVDAPLVMLNAVRARMTAAVEAGLGDRDWSGIADYGLQGETT